MTNSDQVKWRLAVRNRERGEAKGQPLSKNRHPRSSIKSIDLPVNSPSVRPSVHPSVTQSIHPSIHIERSSSSSVRLSINQSIKLTITPTLTRECCCCCSDEKSEWVVNEAVEGERTKRDKDNSNSNFQSHPIHHLSIYLSGWCCSTGSSSSLSVAVDGWRHRISVSLWSIHQSVVVLTTKLNLIRSSPDNRTFYPHRTTHVPLSLPPLLLLPCPRPRCSAIPSLVFYTPSQQTDRQTDRLWLSQYNIIHPSTT